MWGHTSLPVDSGVLAQAGGQWGQYEQYRGTLLGLSLKAGNVGQRLPPPVWTAYSLSPSPGSLIWGNRDE